MCKNVDLLAISLLLARYRFRFRSAAVRYL